MSSLRYVLGKFTFLPLVEGVFFLDGLCSVAALTHIQWSTNRYNAGKFLDTEKEMRRTVTSVVAQRPEITVFRLSYQRLSENFTRAISPVTDRVRCVTYNTTSSFHTWGAKWNLSQLSASDKAFNFSIGHLTGRIKPLRNEFIKDVLFVRVEWSNRRSFGGEIGASVNVNKFICLPFSDSERNWLLRKYFTVGRGGRAGWGRHCRSLMILSGIY